MLHADPHDSVQESLRREESAMKAAVFRDFACGYRNRAARLLHAARAADACGLAERSATLTAHALDLAQLANHYRDRAEATLGWSHPTPAPPLARAA